MFKYQYEFIKFVNEKIGKKIFRKGDFCDFLFCVPQDEKQMFYNEFCEVKGWTMKELEEKLF